MANHDPRPGPTPLDSTADLLARVRGGDRDALDALIDRCMPALRRWARGRLPAGARGLVDTQDIVQDAIVRALGHLDTFESRHEGALQAYLRQAVINRIRDEARRVERRPVPQELGESMPFDGASPLDIAIGRQGVSRYEAALRQLKESDREAIIGRIEMQHDYETLAGMLGKTTADAARIAVKRAIARLLDLMDHES